MGTNEEEKEPPVETSRVVLVIGILAVLFFVASAYGVQRTILSTFASEQLEFTQWFENWAWISIAFTLSGFGLFKALAGLFTGAYTMKVGTKPIILVGAGCFVVGALPLLFSEGDPLLLGIGNSILGAGEGLLYAGAMTYLSDVSTTARRALWMGIMELAVYGGYSFGAMIAGVITMITDAPGASFAFSAIVSFFGLILAIFAIRSTVITGTQEELEKLRTPIETPQAVPRFRSLVLRPTVIITALNGHISKMVDSIIVLYLPLLLSNVLYGYKLSIQNTGLITAVFTLSWAIAMPFAGNISDRIGRKTPTFVGLLIESFALLGLQAGNSPFPILFILSAVGGIGVGLYYPVLPSIAVDIAPETEKPKIIGFYRAIKDLGYFTGPLVAGLVAQMWYDTNPQDFNSILRVPLMLAGLLLLIGAIGLIIVRETRPAWTQFQTTVEHAQLVEKCVIQSTKGLLVYLEQEAIDNSNFQERLSRYSLRAKDLELEADDQLEKIIVRTYRSLYKTPDAGNFLRIARRLDRVAGLTLGALFQIQAIPIERVPPLIQEKLHDASIALRSLVRTTVDVLQVLEIKLDAVAGMYRVARDRESDLDLLYQIMNQHLFISAQQMHYGTWYAIKDVINMIEQAADSAEDAAEVINMLAIKYRT
ncbi:MAG: MFS transporter [Candidatus Heimdallarchaeota archaeon]|nr:MAG: MFS transporter [Candidatus Heimdallarchaeota archaeon]